MKVSMHAMDRVHVLRIDSSYSCSLVCMFVECSNPVSVPLTALAASRHTGVDLCGV